MGVLHDRYDWQKDADDIPALLEQKMSSPSITPGRYDIVVDPSNLWLTIHESIGHSTELDRVLGTRPTTRARRSRRSTSSTRCSSARR